MKAEVTPEHAWLRRLAGEWTFEMEYMDGEPQAPGKLGDGSWSRFMTARYRSVR